MPALLALAAACTFGVADFLGGLCTRRAAVAAITLTTNVAGALLAIVLVFTIGGEWTSEAIGWGAVAGVAGLVGLVLLYQGLADGPNRLVSPLSAVVAAIVPVAVGVSLGDRPSALAVAGLAVAPVAIWLVAGGDLRMTETSKRPIALGIGAGLGFGTIFALIAQTPDDAGAVPLVAARATSVTILIIAVVVTRPGAPPRRYSVSPSSQVPSTWPPTACSCGPRSTVISPSSEHSSVSSRPRPCSSRSCSSGNDSTASKSQASLSRSPQRRSSAPQARREQPVQAAETTTSGSAGHRTRERVATSEPAGLFI